MANQLGSYAVVPYAGGDKGSRRWILLDTISVGAFPDVGALRGRRQGLLPLRIPLTFDMVMPCPGGGKGCCLCESFSLSIWLCPTRAAARGHPAPCTPGPGRFPWEPRFDAVINRALDAHACGLIEAGFYGLASRRHEGMHRGIHPATDIICRGSGGRLTHPAGAAGGSARPHPCIHASMQQQRGRGAAPTAESALSDRGAQPAAVRQHNQPDPRTSRPRTAAPARHRRDVRSRESRHARSQRSGDRTAASGWG